MCLDASFIWFHVDLYKFSLGHLKITFLHGRGSIQASKIVAVHSGDVAGCEPSVFPVRRFWPSDHDLSTAHVVRAVRC